MRTIYFNGLFFLLAILSFNACEKNDEPDNNLKDIDTEIGLYDFYLYDVNSNENIRITSSPNQIESSYSISPDSKKILYVNENGVNIMNIDGSENSIILSKGSSPCFSLDGEKLIFVDDNKLYSINSDGSNKSQIVKRDIGLWHPVLSKDGERIACSSDSGLCIVSFDGQINVISSSNSADWYDWSSDSKELFYSRFLSDNFAQIYKYNVIENKEYQLTNIEKYNYSPMCNLLNNDIIFTSSHADYGSDLVLMNSKGLNLNVILHKDNISSPYWSPMGNTITFITENSNLAIVEKDGDNYRIINEIPGACMNPLWSSDGKFILYYRAIFFN